jgi:hypothetical protein
MTIVGQVMQHMHDPGVDAQGRILGNAQGLSDLVCGLEPDAPDVLGKPVGIVLYDGDDIIAVLLVDFGGIGRADPMALQEDHHTTNGLLVLPSLADHVDALLADALDLSQSLGLVFDDVQGLFTEVIDDASGDDRTDALDQPGTEIFANGMGRGQQKRFTVLNLELLPILRMRLTYPFHFENLARRG